MTDIITKSDIQEQIVRAVVTRADGTVEDLGVIAYYHKSRFRRMVWQVVKFFKEKRNGRTRPE
ncbi:hypothetical protein EVB27_044 [Rhizobium phage RHph_TM16]|nr:hypothetical protein EVB27_044 [Rhizobium phage RHph_TM16]